MKKLKEFLVNNLNITSENKYIFYTIVFIAFIFLSFIVFVSPVRFIGLIIGAFFLVLSLLKPQWVVIFLAVYIPLEPFALKFVPDEIYIFARYFSEVLIYLLLMSAGWKLIIREKKFKQTPIDLPFILFCIVLIVSAVINFVPLTTTVLGIRQILRFILLYYAVIYLAIDKQFIKKIIYVLFFIVLFEATLGLAQGVIGAPADEFLIPGERKVLADIQLTSGTDIFWEEGTRIFATMGRYDQLGTFLSFFLLIAVGLIYQIKNKKFKRFLYLVPIVGIPALVLTYSRASWFGFLLGVLFISIIIKKDRRFLYLFIGAIIAIVSYLTYSGIVVYYLIDIPGQTLIERFFEAFSYERWIGEYYGFGRLFFIVNTILVVVPSFLFFGTGAGQYGGGATAALHNTTIYNKLGLPFGVYGTEGYIDNNWFSILGETGIIGFIFYVSMFVVLFWSVLKIYKKSKSRLTQGLCLGFLGCILAVSLQAFLGTYLEVRTLAFYFWLMAAFIFTMARQEKVNII